MLKMNRWIPIEGFCACLITLLLAGMGWSEPSTAIPAAILAGCFCAFGAWLVFKRPAFARRAAGWLDQPQHLPGLVLTLVGALGVEGSVTALAWSPYGHWLKWLAVSLTNAWPLALWVMLGTLQCLLGLLDARRPALFSLSIWKQPEALQALIGLITVLVVLLHWSILIFNLPLFDMIPGWFWKFTYKPFSLNDLLFPLIVGLALGAAWLALSGKLRGWKMLLVLALLGVATQFAFGFIEGQGVEALRLKYATSAHVSYAEHASDDPVLWDALTQYERLYSQDIYLGTKPPGVLLVYMVMQIVSAWLFSPSLFQQRVLALTTLIAWVFPFVSMLALWPLTALKRQTRPGSDDLLPALFYIISPNVVLIPLFLDQVSYPLLFCVCLLLWWAVLKRASLPLAFLCGLLVYGALYFSFSMLPLVPLMLAWWALETWRKREFRQVSGWIKPLTGLVLGLLTGFMLLRFGLNYDILQRYTAAMLHHREVKAYESGLGYVLQSLFTNTVDISAWSGFPIIVLFVVSVFFSAVRFCKGRAGAIDSLILAFSGTYLALNLFGQTRGEVGRIWIFMVPLLILGAVQTLGFLTKGYQKRGWVYALIVVQLLTVFLTFHLQDFFA